MQAARPGRADDDVWGLLAHTAPARKLVISSQKFEGRDDVVVKAVAGIVRTISATSKNCRELIIDFRSNGYHRWTNNNLSRLFRIHFVMAMLDIEQTKFGPAMETISAELREDQKMLRVPDLQDPECDRTTLGLGNQCMDSKRRAVYSDRRT